MCDPGRICPGAPPGVVEFDVTVSFDLAPPVSECAGDLRFEFTDPLFNNDEWTSFKHFESTPPPPRAIFDARQTNSEGNPAPSRSVLHDYCGVGGFIVAHWHDTTFDPGAQAANVVTIAFDARMFPWVTGSTTDMVLRVLVKQGDSFYEGPQIEVEALDFSWKNHRAACMTSEAMTKRAGPGPNRPDFSQPMQFGYATANSAPNTGCSVRESLVDNFFAEVR